MFSFIGSWICWFPQEDVAKGFFKRALKHWCSYSNDFFKSKVLFFLILREVSFQIYLQTRDLYREARRPRRASNFIGIEVTFVLIQKFVLGFVFVGKTQRVVSKESQLHKLPLLLFLSLVFLHSKWLFL